MFGREVPDLPGWMADIDVPNTDMFATVDETADDILALYRRAWANTDAVVEELGLDAAGAVPWWPPERRTVSVRQVLVHVIADTTRHAGHADIVRELVDGRAGIRPDNSNLPDVDARWWPGYVGRLEQIARDAKG